MDNLRKEFLIASIADIQSTIRAIDTKLISILVILLIPITTVGKVALYIHHFLISNPPIYLHIIMVFTLILFVLFWLLSLFAVLNGISSIDNPSEHLCDLNCSKGTFYNGGLYPVKLIDAFFNRKDLKSIVALNEQIIILPQNENDAVKELLLEQHKLAYIRDIKIIRQKVGFKLLIYFLLLGFFLWLICYLLTITKNV
jgi:hypothetical protein